MNGCWVVRSDVAFAIKIIILQFPHNYALYPVDYFTSLGALTLTHICTISVSAHVT